MRAQVTRHEASGQSWLLATRPACAAVATVVPLYVGYEERCDTPVRRLEVPHPNITVIINLGTRLSVQAPALQPVAGDFGSFSAGLHDTAVITESVGHAAGIELNLSPLGMWQLLGVRMEALYNRVVSLEDIVGHVAPALEDRLRNTADWDQRFDMLDTALTAQLAGRTPPRELQWAWTQLVGAPGETSIGVLTSELRWSRRRLAEAFREYVGMTPKSVARVMRFDRAVRAVRDGRWTSWSSLALECGYADQAHLTREFREFSGLTPTRFQQRLGVTGLDAA